MIELLRVIFEMKSLKENSTVYNLIIYDIKNIIKSSSDILLMYNNFKTFLDEQIVLNNITTINYKILIDVINNLKCFKPNTVEIN